LKIERREKLLLLKIDSLYKHAGQRRVLDDIGKVKCGEFYYFGTNQHVNNERIFYSKGGDLIVQKLAVRFSKSGGGNWYSLRPFS
jgi:hypothetical protein